MSNELNNKMYEIKWQFHWCNLTFKFYYVLNGSLVENVGTIKDSIVLLYIRKTI